MTKSDLILGIIGLVTRNNWFKIKRLARRSQYWDSDRIKEYQLDQTKKLLIHAYETTAYYKEQMDIAHFNPYNFKEISELKKLPIINKQIITERFSDFVSTKKDNFAPIAKHTGGTTGTAFNFLSDRKSWFISKAMLLGSYRESGVRIGRDKIMVFAGGSLCPGEKMSLSRKVWRWVMNYHYVSITSMNKSSMEEELNYMRKHKVQFIRGYPSAIYSFAEYLHENDLKYPLKRIFTTAEMLLQEHRDLFECVFQCKTINQYGSGDGNNQAYQCNEIEGLHICPITNLVELLDESGQDVEDGNEGSIVTTSLTDYAMPFIRYQVGDSAIKLSTKCSCSKTTDQYFKILGRTTDQIKFSNGIVLNGLSIPFEDMKDNQLENYQIVQTDHDAIEFVVVPKANFTKQNEQTIIDMLHHYCGKGVQVSVKYVDKIETPTSGKMRYVISKIKKHNTD